MEDIRLDRLLTSTFKAYHKHQQRRLIVPIDMAEFILKEKVTSQATTYFCAQFLFSGKAKAEDRPLKQIAEFLSINERTVYRHFEWLIERNWIGKDTKNGWYFFRGLDFIRGNIGFKSRKSARMTQDDLKTPKEFFVGAIINSIAKTRNDKTERKKGRSLQSFVPISLATFEKTIGICKKTAFTYRKESAKKYYTMIPNLKQVSSIQPVDIKRLKSPYFESVTLNLFGSKDTINVRPQQLRTHYGRVFVQLANLIRPNLGIITNRRRVRCFSEVGSLIFYR